MRLADRALTLLENTIIVVTLSAASLLGLMQVVLRYGFGYGFEWSEGVTIALVIWGSLVGASAAAHRHMHIRLDLVVDAMPPRWQHLTEVGAALVVLFFVGYVLILSIGFEMYLYQSGMQSLMTYLPEWVGFLGAPIALALMFIRYVQTLVLVLQGGRMGGTHTTE